MKTEKHTYSEYMENSKRLFIMLFGAELYRKLAKTKLKSIDWTGIDVDASGIIATFPNIKERFGEKWIEYFNEKNITLLELYLQVIFHYGFQQAKDDGIKTEEMLNAFINIAENDRKRKENAMNWIKERIKTTKVEKAALGIDTPDKLKQTAGKGGKLRGFKEVLAYLETH